MARITMKQPVRLDHPSIALQKQADEILKGDRRGIWAEKKPKRKKAKQASKGKIR